MFDSRSATRYSASGPPLVEHKSYILKVAVPKGLSNNLVISGSTNGDVKLWDIRKNATINTITNLGGLAALAVHDYASTLACGLTNQKIRVTNFSGEDISMIKYHDGFLGQRIGPVTCLAFHPHKVILAAGATDSIVSVYNGTQS